MSARVIVAFVRLQNGAQLRPDAFGEMSRMSAALGLRARETVGGGGKAELSRLPCEAHQPKAVLAEYLFRPIDGAQAFRPYIRDSV